jgi:hypothetical protein
VVRLGFGRDQPVMTLVQEVYNLWRLLVYSRLLGIMKHVPSETFVNNYLELWNSFKPELFVLAG